MRELGRRGKPVRAVNRSGNADVPEDVDVVAADVYQSGQAEQAAEGATIIYQCAQPGYTEWPAKFPPLQERILDAAINLEAKFVVPENLYMYGPVNGPITEDLPYTPTTRKGKVRAEMAQAIHKAVEAGKLQAVQVRASDFYGPHVEGSAFGEIIFKAVAQGKTAQAAGNIDLPHSYTYIDDFAKALVIVGEHEEAMGQVWLVPNAPVTTTRELIEKAYAIAGHPPKIRAASRWMLRAVGLFVPEVREMVEMLYEFEEPFVVDSSKFVNAFGDIATPFDEGLRHTVEWYQQHVEV
jgi:nucleoside-diphosphate-sugar epimerase